MAHTERRNPACGRCRRRGAMYDGVCSECRRTEEEASLAVARRGLPPDSEAAVPIRAARIDRYAQAVEAGLPIPYVRPPNEGV